MDILLLEDDIDLGQAVADHLESFGHVVRWMKLCQQATKALADPAIALALFDMRLPDGDGLEVIRQMRARGDRRPVIALTARDQVSDRVRGLQAGADDYLVKPFDLDELMARIEAVARRSGALPPHSLHSSELAIDFAAKSARLAGKPLTLTAMEWALLGCLSSQPGRIWGRADLMRAVYPQGDEDVESNSLEVVISRLRRKIGAELITTHRGLGYRFEQTPHAL